MTAWMPFLSIPAERGLSASLGAPDWQLSHYTVSLLHRSVDPETLRAAVERDSFPVPSTADRKGYHGDRHLDYCLNGSLDFSQLRQTFEAYSGRHLRSSVMAGSVWTDLGPACLWIKFERLARHYTGTPWDWDFTAHEV